MRSPRTMRNFSSAANRRIWNVSARFSAFPRTALLVVACFSLMTSLYSFRFMEAHPRRVEYYAYYLAALGATFGAVLADNLIVFLLFRAPALLNARGLHSDAAVTGLQAMHLMRGEWSRFIWGTNYQGIPEAALIAALFSATGPDALGVMLIPM